MTQPDYFPQPGDLFACWGRDLVSRFISLETSSLIGPRAMRFAPSHVAIACPRWFPKHHQELFWWESTTMTARHCLEAEKPVSGCQVHRIRERLQDYVVSGGSVQVYRLTEFDSLAAHEVTQLRALLGNCVGDSEDPYKSPVTYDTAGALCSGTRIVRRLTFWRNQLDTLFCSELLSAVLQRLGRMNRENPSEYNPGTLMRQLIAQGTYAMHTEFTCPEDWRLR